MGCRDVLQKSMVLFEMSLPYVTATFATPASSGLSSLFAVQRDAVMLAEGRSKESGCLLHGATSSTGATSCTLESFETPLMYI